MIDRRNFSRLFAAAAVAIPFAANAQRVASPRRIVKPKLSIDEAAVTA